MPRSLSRSQIDKLGLRLTKTGYPATGDLDLLEELLRDYRLALARAQKIVRGSLPKSFLLTSRLKSTGTTIDKLRRGTSLSSMQDIAGLRVWGRSTLYEQDEVVDRLRRAFGSPKVIDRRDSPTHGYRAVHLIPNVDGCPVEIQVRTHLQDLWAQVVEKLGDAWGRQIRYGGQPDDPDAPAGHVAGISPRQLLDNLMSLSVAIASVEERMASVNNLEGTVADLEERVDSQGLLELESVKERLLGVRSRTQEAEMELEWELKNLVERLK